MKRLLPILLLPMVFFSCQPEKNTDLFDPNVEVICVYTPRKIEDGSNASLIYQGILRTTDSLGIAYRSIFPFNFQEGADSIAQLVSKNQPGRKRLIIAIDPEYSSYLQPLAEAGQITNSESTQLLVLDGDFKHDDVYTAHICHYGLLYQAGYVASQMSDVDSVQIVAANTSYLYLREGRDGFIHGFTKERANTIDIYDLTDLTADNSVGFQIRQLAYSNIAPDSKKRYDMVVPLCGETIMGFLRYSRDFPGSFYTVGMEQDMSIYSQDVPFSCIEHTDKIISACILDWMQNKLSHYRRFGLDEGWVEFKVSTAYREQLEPCATTIFNEAIEKEVEYVK